VKISLHSEPLVKARLSVVQGEMGCFGDNRGGGECREAVVWLGETAERGSRATEKLPLPKGGSPVHALIEFVRRFRLEEWVAHKAPFLYFVPCP
jgi:hypothetical protein